MIRTKPDSKLALAVIAGIVGFTANLAQVSLFRFFMGLFYGTEMHLGIFLAIWLAGISFGGYLGGRKTLSLPWLLNFIILTSIFAFVAVYSGYRFLPDPEGGFLPFQPVVIFMLFCILPVSMLIGMLLPAMIARSDRSLGIYYSYEAIGGFIGGIFFSLILGGTANPIICLLSLPIPIIAALTLLYPGYLKGVLLILILVPAIFFKSPDIAEKIENNYWQMANKNLELLKTAETPYQKLQLCSYHEQKSLFSNGMFSYSWPLAESAEEKVHSFVTALKNFDEILILGAPTPDVVKEFLKYPQLNLTIVELDAKVFDFLEYNAEIRKSVKLVIDDPRSFLNSTGAKYDGIMIYPVSPVTLAGNRLFTIEAFTAMNRCLKPTGVLSLQVSGTENYLGSIKEQIILSTWQGLGKIFRMRTAFPGSTITFFASQSENVIPPDVKGFINRFKQREIKTLTFYPMSFFNILQPFRVKELKSWLDRDVKAKLNTDAHPESFTQQLELWNIYSGASVNRVMSWLQQRTLKQLIFSVILVGMAVLLLLLVFRPESAMRKTIAGGVAISGATGLFSEIILILLYQNSYGAAYQMSAFFFGVYMLGLASGAWLFGRFAAEKTALKRLKLVKVLQAIFTLSCILLVDQTSFHSVFLIAIAIFAISFLDGIEFPVADKLLRTLGQTPSSSAGMLLFSDNAGALAAGLVSGLWLLPTIGMKGSFFLLTALLLTNLAILLVISRRR
jgi:predicted membrane-bound spermidine synthase